jgi:hypothetical protein
MHNSEDCRRRDERIVEIAQRQTMCSTMPCRTMFSTLLLFKNNVLPRSNLIVPSAWV